MREESKDLKLIRRLIELNESVALNGNDIFYLSAERMSFLSDKAEKQAETIERLSEEIKELKEKIYYYELPGKLIEQQQAD